MSMDGLISLIVGFIIGVLFTMQFATYNHRIEDEKLIKIENRIYKCEFLDNKDEK